MPDQTTILSLPLILPAQAQKHVTHNEALRLLDVLVHLTVADRTRTVPPGAPAVGARHIVAAGASGLWAGQAGKIALWEGSAWAFFAPLPGWRAFIEAEDAVAVQDGTGWFTPADGPLTVARLGVGAVPDATNRLSVTSPATLFTHAGAGHQVKLNKAAAGDTASLLFQTGFSGRAEIGTTGSDDLAVKVSADGTSYLDAIQIARASGIVSLPQGVNAGSLVLRDPGDPAKRAVFSAAGLTSGATRSYTLPDLSSEIATLGGAQTFTGNKTFSGVTTFTGTNTVIDGNLSLLDDVDPTKRAQFQLTGISTGTTRVYSLPDVSSEIVTLAGNQTFTATKTFAGMFVNGSFTATASLCTFGGSTATATYGLGSGATLSGNTKTINIGSSGVAGSTTVVTIGSAVAGAAGSLLVNSPTVTFAPSVTSVAMPQAAVAAQVLGLGGATADLTNRLSVNAPAVLLNHAGAGMEATLNKAAAGNDAAIAFKTGFSARALAGLLGNDNFTLKVSATGASYLDAFTVAAGSGQMTLAQPAVLAGQASDPAGPANGTLWHDSTLGRVKMRLGGVTRVLDSQFDLPFLVPVAGEYVQTTCGAGGTTTGTTAGAAGRIDLAPFVPRADIAMDAVAVTCTTALAGALAKVALYSADELGRPDALIAETADMDLSTVGVRTAPMVQTLRRGRTYWFGVRTSSTATLSAWPLGSAPDINGGAPSTAARKVLRRTLAYATPATATWGFVSSEINAAPPTAVWLRMA